MVDTETQTQRFIMSLLEEQEEHGLTVTVSDLRDLVEISYEAAEVILMDFYSDKPHRQAQVAASSSGTKSDRSEAQRATDGGDFTGAMAAALALSETSSPPLTAVSTDSSLGSSHGSHRGAVRTVAKKSGSNQDSVYELPLGWARLRDADGIYFVNILTQEKRRSPPPAIGSDIVVKSDSGPGFSPALKCAAPKGSEKKPLSLVQSRSPFDDSIDLLAAGHDSDGSHGESIPMDIAVASTLTKCKSYKSASAAKSTTPPKSITDVRGRQNSSEPLRESTVSRIRTSTISQKWENLLDFITTKLMIRTQLDTLKSLKAIAKNLLRKEECYRILYSANRMLQEKVLRHDGGYEFLRELGFVAVDENRLVCLVPDKDQIDAALDVVNSKLELLQGKRSKRRRRKGHSRVSGVKSKSPKVAAVSSSMPKRIPPIRAKSHSPKEGLSSAIAKGVGKQQKGVAAVAPVGKQTTRTMSPASATRQMPGSPPQLLISRSAGPVAAFSFDMLAYSTRKMTVKDDSELPPLGVESKGLLGGDGTRQESKSKHAYSKSIDSVSQKPLVSALLSEPPLFGDIWDSDEDDLGEAEMVPAEAVTRGGDVLRDVHDSDRESDDEKMSGGDLIPCDKPTDAGPDQTVIYLESMQRFNAMGTRQRSKRVVSRRRSPYALGRGRVKKASEEILLKPSIPTAAALGRDRKRSMSVGSATDEMHAAIAAAKAAEAKPVGSSGIFRALAAGRGRGRGRGGGQAIAGHSRYDWGNPESGSRRRLVEFEHVSSTYAVGVGKGKGIAKKPRGGVRNAYAMPQSMISASGRYGAKAKGRRQAFSPKSMRQPAVGPLAKRGGLGKAFAAKKKKKRKWPPHAEDSDDDMYTKEDEFKSADPRFHDALYGDAARKPKFKAETLRADFFKPLPPLAKPRLVAGGGGVAFRKGKVGGGGLSRELGKGKGKGTLKPQAFVGGGVYGDASGLAQSMPTHKMRRGLAGPRAAAAVSPKAAAQTRHKSVVAVTVLSSHDTDDEKHFSARGISEVSTVMDASGKMSLATVTIDEDQDAIVSPIVAMSQPKPIGVKRRVATKGTLKKKGTVKAKPKTKAFKAREACGSPKRGGLHSPKAGAVKMGGAISKAESMPVVTDATSPKKKKSRFGKMTKWVRSGMTRTSTDSKGKPSDGARSPRSPRRKGATPVLFEDGSQFMIHLTDEVTAMNVVHMICKKKGISKVTAYEYVLCIEDRKDISAESIFPMESTSLALPKFREMVGDLRLEEPTFVVTQALNVDQTL